LEHEQELKKIIQEHETALKVSSEESEKTLERVRNELQNNQA
jgi:hypothetical protein